MLGDAGRFNGLVKSWCVCAMSISGIRLGDVCDGRDNNFNLIRMIAAFSVLVSHAWPLSLGPGAAEPLSLRFSYSLGGLAVIVFFGISGFLITRSFDRQPVGRWASARVLRLAPGLFVALALTVVILGPIVTAWPPGKYWTNGQTYTYVYRNLTLYQMQPKLSGLFLDNPYPAAVNGSLWTLYYEVLCYIAVGVLGLLGFVRHRLWMALAFGVFAVAYLTVLHVLPADAVSNRLQWTFRFGLPFAIGAAFWIWRDHLRLTPTIMALLVVVTYFARATPAFEVLTVFTLRLRRVPRRLSGERADPELQPARRLFLRRLYLRLPCRTDGRALPEAARPDARDRGGRAAHPGARRAVLEPRGEAGPQPDAALAETPDCRGEHRPGSSRFGKNRLNSDSQEAPSGAAR